MPMPRYILILMLTALFAACSPQPAARGGKSPAVVIDRRPDAAPPPRNDASLQRMMIERHNAARAAVNAPSLVWDERLEASALAYARELAGSGRFEHARQSGVPQGENLWTGTRGAFSYREMIDAWIAERADYVRGAVPNNSRNGNPVGHYTQIIWRSTSRVGCATAANQENEVLVCRYSPAGNVYGRNPEVG